MNGVILCGGIGTRLKDISNGNPKILMEVGDKPFIYLLFDSLINNGFNKIYLLISYKSKEIKKVLGSHYKKIPIFYIEDDENLKKGTASALLNAIEKLPNHFLLQYGDTILNINYKNFYKESKSEKDLLLMSIYKNEKNLDKNNVFYQGNSLTYYNTELSDNKQKLKKANYIDYGLLGIHKGFLKKYINLLKENQSLKFFQEKISLLNLIKPFLVTSRFYEIGNPQSYFDLQNAYKNGFLDQIINK